ncbi:hypothetical protein YC2023_078738 [Brassica napus]
MRSSLFLLDGSEKEAEEEEDAKGSSGPQAVRDSFFLAKKCHAPNKNSRKKKTGLLHSIVLSSPLEL